MIIFHVGLQKVLLDTHTPYELKREEITSGNVSSHKIKSLFSVLFTLYNVERPKGRPEENENVDSTSGVPTLFWLVIYF